MTPAMFRKLTLLGLSQEQMAGVLEVFNEVEAKDEHRRAMQRERWQRWHEKKVQTLDKRELTLANDSRAPAPAEGSSSKKEITGQKKVRERSPNGSRLPKDFVPKPGVAKDAGLTREEFDVEIAKFKDHWTAKAGKDARKADWQATWRNWCRRAVEYRKARSGPKDNAEILHEWISENCEGDADGQEDSRRPHGNVERISAEQSEKYEGLTLDLRPATPGRRH